MKKREKVRMKKAEKRRQGILSKLEPDSPQLDMNIMQLNNKITGGIEVIRLDVDDISTGP